ncbi:MAG: ectoine/hydroxyectoine ABC transporter substrate-binding protein EhuB [Actinomycetes bacterium]
MSERTSMSRRDLVRRGAVTGGLLLAPGLLGACSRSEVGTGADTEGGTLQKLKDQGYVTVGFANEAPYAYKEGGELKGEAPAVHGEIFKQLGIGEIRSKLTGFDSLIPGLNADRFDVVTAGMFVTPERCQQALFSEPEYCAPGAFLVPQGNPDGLTDYKSVADKGVKVGVMTGAVEQGYAEGNGVESGNITVLPDPQSGFEALTAGRIDAFALTTISLRQLLETNEGAKVELTEPFTPVVDGKEQLGCGAAVFRKGDQPLVDAFNTELAKLKDSGKLLELIKPYGFTEAELPEDDVTTKMLCGG